MCIWVCVSMFHSCVRALAMWELNTRISSITFKFVTHKFCNRVIEIGDTDAKCITSNAIASEYECLFVCFDEENEFTFSQFKLCAAQQMENHKK